MGDVQLRAFTSFLRHRVQRSVALSQEHDEARANLWVRGESFTTHKILQKHEKLLKQNQFLPHIHRTYHTSLPLCTDQIACIQVKALLAS